MKLSLQLKLGQQLTMTPQLQQAIKLLQLSTIDLQQEIHQALESNPMLEMVEDGDDSGDSNRLNEPSSNNRNEQKTTSDSNDGDSDSDWADTIPGDLAVDTNWEDVYQTTYTTGGGNPEADSFDFDSRNAESETLQDHLFWQLNLTPMSDTDKEIAYGIIEAIDANGMLTTDIESIHAGLDPALEVELDEVLAVLHRIQQFDPVGVGYRDLSECLLIQLNQFNDSQMAPDIANAKIIVRDHLTLLGSRDYAQIMRRAKLKEPELKRAIAIIEGLDPRPGSDIAPPSTSYVIPDVIVTKNPDSGKWKVELNPEIAPRLRINASYAKLVKRADTSDVNTYLRDNLQEARWFLKSLQSRNETLMKVATRIVEHQQDFLEYGEEAMKPLVLHDIAEMVGMHESTISRVTTQKYMHTPRGIFELKFFFSSHVSTAGGGECSSIAIRAIIKKLIAAENVKKPLSDSRITQILEEQGINVARRTIAKYRESLSIPPSNERKRLVD